MGLVRITIFATVEGCAVTGRHLTSACFVRRPSARRGLRVRRARRAAPAARYSCARPCGTLVSATESARHRCRAGPISCCRGTRRSSSATATFGTGERWSCGWQSCVPGTTPRTGWDKIKSNVARDRSHDAELRAMGWRVIRVWETDILKKPQAIAGVVAGLILTTGVAAPGAHAPGAGGDGVAATWQRR